mmetsp:Transcript_18940/g.18084  ORF Transcript_18940/g.18084 Transcript_18940/m.18084 type:complete len:153 (+) Transcript_18940:465-923(+)
MIDFQHQFEENIHENACEASGPGEVDEGPEDDGFIQIAGEVGYVEVPLQENHIAGVQGQEIINKRVDWIELFVTFFFLWRISYLTVDPILHYLAPGVLKEGLGGSLGYVAFFFELIEPAFFLHREPLVYLIHLLMGRHWVPYLVITFSWSFL